MSDSLSRRIEARRDELIALTQALIRIPTLNPPGENYRAICDMLKARYPQWTDDQLFGKARMINAALLIRLLQKSGCRRPAWFKAEQWFQWRVLWRWCL